jgi:hypothetical protein
MLSGVVNPESPVMFELAPLVASPPVETGGPPGETTDPVSAVPTSMSFDEPM